jgi:hypothetical protein
MADNLPKHMYPTRDDSEAIRAPSYETQFEDLYNLVNQLLLKVDGHKTKLLAPSKQHSIPPVPADVVSNKGGAWTSTPRLYLLI